MKFTSFEKERLGALNDAEYGRYSSFFSWADGDECAEATIVRDSLIENIEDVGSQFDFLGSKADTRYLSPGCRICGQGRWSCLFINGMCNASCFYCPGRQDSQLKPATNTFEFESPVSYADYVNYFGFKGVSFSGGEPFITFDLMIKYLKTVRKKCDSSIYTWAYTNGSLVNEDMLRKLKDEGLNEIRFDIGAFDYSLKKAIAATKIIDTVTVEIPMIPDHFDRVKNLLKPMKDEGIKHLNLHQLRVTPYNLPKMIEKDYKFLHGRKVTVFKSEISALKILLHSIKTGGVPVNYCSFIFKESFQSSATRKRYAKRCVEPVEHITQNGYIRHVEPDDDKKFVKVIYFNPSATGKISLAEGVEKYDFERKKIVSYKLTLSDHDAVYSFIEKFSFEKTPSGRLIETVPDFDTTGKMITNRQFNEIFNFEILRGGFADYF